MSALRQATTPKARSKGPTTRNSASDSSNDPDRPNRRIAPQDKNRLPGASSSLNVLERSGTRVGGGSGGIASSSSSSSTAAADREVGSGDADSVHSARTSSRSGIEAENLSNSSSSGGDITRNGSASRGWMVQAMQPFLDSSTSSSIQPTDLELLTTSILSNQERQHTILRLQENLISRNVSLSELKQSLLYLTSTSWGQILEERNLSDKCSYPTCCNPSPSQTQASLRNKNGRLTSLATSSRSSPSTTPAQQQTQKKKEGKFSINLSQKSIKDLDSIILSEPGNTFHDLKQYFCSKDCYAKSEWILRWILTNDNGNGNTNSNTQSTGGSGQPGGGGGGGSGKWNQLIANPTSWEELELLEDILASTENGELGSLLESDAVSVAPTGAADIAVESTHPSQKFPNDKAQSRSQSNEVGPSSSTLPSNTSRATGLEVPQPGASSGSTTTTRPQKPDDMVGELKVIERKSDTSAAGTALSGANTRTKAAVYEVDVPNHMGMKLMDGRLASHKLATSSSSSAGQTKSTDAGSDSGNQDEQDEGDDDLDMRQVELSKILRFASMASGSSSRSQRGATNQANNHGPRSPTQQQFSTEMEEEECEEPVQQSDEMKELNRIMNLALDVRTQQRELGLLE